MTQEQLDGLINKQQKAIEGLQDRLIKGEATELISNGLLRAIEGLQILINTRKAVQSTKKTNSDDIAL